MSEATAGPVSSADLVEQALLQFEKPLVGYAMTIVHNLETARDVVQDTFLRLHEQNPATVRESLKAWLFTVCRNRALDVLRKQKREAAVEPDFLQSVPDDCADPAEAAERQETHARVLELLDRLSPNQREVIRLRFQNGLSYREISEVTSLSVSNVGFLMHTGLKRLRTFLSS
ncbi:MAG TPA: sigma-70 family RNA polymerase sigma factor [Verrucomicrobiales bacterium]|nr:sigma-70 family RNA polymerase sigma factor [Verrucomicrobiales bacterium]